MHCSAEERFCKKVRKDAECWEWLAAKDIKGYGWFHFEERTQSAHRVALKLEGVKIPDGMLVCHHCDNPGCVNPDHLFIGTSQDNISDMIAKGRLSYRKGSSNPRSKLIDEDVLRIRDMLKLGAAMTEIGVLFGVTAGVIFKIKNGISWKHV